MALTLRELQALKDHGFDKLFQKNKAAWTKKAANAYTYFNGNLPTGETTRIDDVAGVLLPTLEVDVELRTFLQNKKLSQKYWILYFCDFILEQVWSQIKK